MNMESVKIFFFLKPKRLQIILVKYTKLPFPLQYHAKLKPFEQVSTFLHPASFFQTDGTDDV